MEPVISAILMAAGLSQRMGKDKLMLPYRGKSMLQNAADLLSVLPVSEKILVTTRKRLEILKLPHGVRAVINHEPEAGQSGSIRLGVSAAGGNWYMFLAADQPGLNPADLQQLIDCVKYHDNGIIYPVVNGNPSTPSLFSARFRAELLSLTGDTGGRTVRAGHPEACVAITPACEENFFDIDSDDDYQNMVINRKTEITE